MLAFSLADEIVSKTLLKNPTERIENMRMLTEHVQRALLRIEGGGRALDFNLAKPCLFCAAGTYKVRNKDKIPSLAEWERSRSQQTFQSHKPLENNQEYCSLEFGVSRRGVPLVLVCDYCGNVQHFRLDLTQDQLGKNWKT